MQSMYWVLLNVTLNLENLNNLKLNTLAQETLIKVKKISEQIIVI